MGVHSTTAFRKGMRSALSLNEGEVENLSVFGSFISEDR